MFVSTGEKQISLPSENVNELLISSSVNENHHSSDGFLPAAAEALDSPKIHTVFTDVSIVPEHERSELELSLENLEEEIRQLRLKQRMIDEGRKEALNKILDIKGSIRVFCRVRPFMLANKRIIHEPISTKPEKVVVNLGARAKEFEFDKVFPQEASQEQVFEEVEPIIRSALDGQNVCVFAYGQTGTGKTFTMDGTNEQPGIIPHTFKELFRLASLNDSSSLTFSMSMLEVYMGSVRDLLAPKSPFKAYTPIRCNLNIQTDTNGFVEIEGLSEVQIPDYAKAEWWYNKGRCVRSTSWTNVNEASSRSHCLTRITICRLGDPLEAKPKVNKLWMVDLGGSERLLKTGATGLTLDEGRAINLSLSALGDVIAALRKKRGHVPYRNSKLTQLLKDSLGDKSKALMLVHISPSEEEIGETICSLTFARRARGIEPLKEEVPVELKRQREKKIMELEEELREAEKQNQEVRNQINSAELKLRENRKLFSTTYGHLEEKTLIISTEEDIKKDIVTATPPALKKPSRTKLSNSVPRFMTSTAASRQRQSAVEREIVVRARNMRSMVTRGSIQFSYSQSLKDVLQISNGKPAKSHLTESPKCNSAESKVASLPRRKLITSSDPNLSIKLCRHRRRMSNLI